MSELLRQVEAEGHRAWEKARAAWQADVFNPEKEKAVERAADKLRTVRRALAAEEGREWPSDREGFKDDEQDGSDDA